MVSLNALVLTLALSSHGETVLLDFTAPWCGPCQSMEPTIQRLKAQGFPIRQINIDQHPELAAQFRARSIPCFVMLSQGKEVDRVVGAASYDHLLRMLQKVQRPAAASGPARSTPRAAQPNSPPITLAAARSVAPASKQADASNLAGHSLSPQQRAFLATVRLKVDDAQGFSYGTGTIIDTHGPEALIITCAHVFRDSKGKGKIHIDFFHSGAKQTVDGQLIAYDMERDVALVAMRPGVEVTAVRVASKQVAIGRGDAVFSVGCDRGADPSLQRSRITGVNKYLGPANFEVAGQPVDGRSGGGLFSTRGELIGVCNAADPADNEGIYAALPIVHWQLDQLGLEGLYQTSAPESLAREQSPAPPAAGANLQLADHRGPTSAPPLRAISRQELEVRRSGGLEELLRIVREAPRDGEVICVVRDPAGSNDRVVVLDAQSCRRLAEMSAQNAAGSFRGGGETPPSPRPRPRWETDTRDAAGRIIRAQSAY